MPAAIGGDNLPPPVGIGLTDLPNIGGGGGAVPASLYIIKSKMNLTPIYVYHFFQAQANSGE